MLPTAISSCTSSSETSERVSSEKRAVFEKASFSGESLASMRSRVARVEPRAQGRPEVAHRLEAWRSGRHWSRSSVSFSW